MSLDPTVSVIDDDAGMLKSLGMVFEAAGFDARTYASAEEFLDDASNSTTTCIVLDLRLTGMGGLELLELLRSRQNTTPVIIITGHGDVQSAVRAMKLGATDLLEKPIEHHELVAKVRSAITLENDRRLYKINAIALRGLEIAGTDKEEGRVVVTFDMTVHAYFSSISELSSSLGERSISPNPLSVDPFMPVISAGLPPNLHGLVEVERSDLKAVIPGKAFVLDQDNTIRTMQEGDEVYLGYVTKVDPEGGRLECTLNKGGIIEKVALNIRYGPQQNAKTR